jgi:hypothetical protein
MRDWFQLPLVFKSHDTECGSLGLDFGGLLTTVMSLELGRQASPALLS